MKMNDVPIPKPGNQLWGIMCKTGHAFPLVLTRFLRQRIRRGASADRPGDMLHRRPLTQHIRGLEQAVCMTLPRPLHVRDQSASAYSPYTQARQRAVRESTWCAVENGSKTGKGLRPSKFPVALMAQTEGEPWSARNYTLNRIAVFMFAPASFSVPILKVSRYVLI